LTFTGFADDLITIRYREKIFLQLFAAMLMINGGYTIDSFHGVFYIYELPYWLEITVSLFVFVVVVNSLNLIDGLDGMASFISIKFFLITGGIILVSNIEWFLFFPIIISALLGFLWFNFNSNKKVFLGDAGSLFLGTIMAFFIFYILDSESNLITDSLISRPLLAILLLLYPLIDTLRAFIIRAYNNKSPFVADRVHLHHRLADKGYQHWQASVLTFSLSVLITVINFLLFNVIGFLGCIVLTCALLVLFYILFFK
jgi:UDP-N-acetylmuramyl pentapeptide phosphotransferase/UDP-N-acetylglucosamine-1-phosphate transferase